MTRTYVNTSFPVSVIVEDGRIVEIRKDIGWESPNFQIEDADGNFEEVPMRSDEGQAAITAMESATFVVTTTELQNGTEPLADNHCESDGSDTCLVHFGRFGLVGQEYTDVCDLSPDWTDV